MLPVGIRENGQTEETRTFHGGKWRAVENRARVPAELIPTDARRIVVTLLSCFRFEVLAAETCSPSTSVTGSSASSPPDAAKTPGNLPPTETISGFTSHRYTYGENNHVSRSCCQRRSLVDTSEYQLLHVAGESEKRVVGGEGS